MKIALLKNADGMVAESTADAVGADIYVVENESAVFCKSIAVVPLQFAHTAAQMAREQIDYLLCGAFGAAEAAEFFGVGVQVIDGVSGNAAESAAGFANGTLVLNNL
jgi:predicted Fe-Mo cluster-binding NifX family protein